MLGKWKRQRSKKQGNATEYDASRLYPEGVASVAPTFAARDAVVDLDAAVIPKDGMQPDLAYQLCHDELALDAQTSLNLASFVTTYMDEHANRLIEENINKNLVDRDEYPQASVFEHRCLKMLASLFHVPDLDELIHVTGTATVGSSEAIMLAGLAMKKRWVEQRKAAGLSVDSPNIVMGRDVQVVWEKFACYFDVEARYIPMTPTQFIVDPERICAQVDEHTIGVVAILGSTFTGAFEPVEAIHDALQALNQAKGWDVGIHVDAASGGFVAPFLYPDLKWDFRLPLVRSLNVSGHKYGLVYPGIGWVLWRDASVLPRSLVFDVNYLGGHMPTFNLNFSRPSAFVIAQYYNFLRLGFNGYRNIMRNLMTLTAYISKRLKAMGPFVLVSEPDALPVVAWRLEGEHTYTVFSISHQLRAYGWVVPAYRLPEDATSIALLRVVVREGMSHAMAKDLCDSIEKVLRAFDEGDTVKGHDRPFNTVC